MKILAKEFAKDNKTESDLNRLSRELVKLERFSIKWGDGIRKLPSNAQRHWVNLHTLFECPPEIRKAIYTTNTIESLNSVILAATKRRKLFRNDESTMKVIYRAISQAAKK